MNSRSTILLIALAFACVAISGCHGLQQDVAGRIKGELPKFIGPADNYDVSIDANPFAIGRGHIHKIQIDGTNVKISPALTVSDFNAETTDVRVNVLSGALEHCNPVSFTAMLTQDNINQYTLATASTSPDSPQNVHIVLNDHDITVKFEMKRYGVTLPITIRGDLVRSGASKTNLDFLASSGQLGWIHAPTPLVRMALDRINPVVSLAGIGVPISVDHAIVDRQRMFVTGSASIASVNSTIGAAQ
jgi:hypothetical protein